MHSENILQNEGKIKTLSRKFIRQILRKVLLVENSSINDPTQRHRNAGKTNGNRKY